MLNEAEFFIQLRKHTTGKDMKGQPETKWSFEVLGIPVVVTTDQLLNQNRFRAAVFKVVGEYPPRRAPVNYDRWLDKMLENAIDESAAPQIVA